MDTQQYINNFFQNAVVSDFSRDYLLRVLSIQFDGPGGLVLNETDLLYAKTAKLPGRVIVNQPVKYAGQTFNVPGSVEYPGAESYELEFYCPEQSTIRERLMNESHRQFGNVIGLQGSGSGGGSIANAGSRIELIQLNKNLDAICTYYLIGANIREVGEMSYNIAEGNGAIQSFSVKIAYHYFTRKLVNGVSPNNS
jgi:hypothetical protein